MKTIARALSSEEIAVLGVLMQEGPADEDRAAREVATTLDRETLDLAAVLAKLERDGLVAREPDAGRDCWRSNFGAPIAS